MLMDFYAKKPLFYISSLFTQHYLITLKSLQTFLRVYAGLCEPDHRLLNTYKGFVYKVTLFIPQFYSLYI